MRLQQQEVVVFIKQPRLCLTCSTLTSVGENGGAAAPPSAPGDQAVKQPGTSSSPVYTGSVLPQLLTLTGGSSLRLCLMGAGEREEPPAADPGGGGGGEDHHAGQPEQGRREVRKNGGPGGPGRPAAGEGEAVQVRKRPGGYKYERGGAAQEHKRTIYILIVFDGTIFRQEFPLVF